MSSPEATEPKQSNSYAELEKPIQEIIAFVNKFDEKYREKCFEILLTFYLMGKTGKTITIVKEELEKKEKEEEAPKEEFEIPIDVKAFLSRQTLSEDIISKLFLIHKGDIRPIYKLPKSKITKAQIQVALLTALEHALKVAGNKFEFSVENVRTQCQTLNVYDSANFLATFKRHGKLFNGLTDEEHVELSPDGQTELAETILIVTK